MLAIFLKTLPFFALIGLGWWAARRRIFPAEAGAALTKFVFFFALTAMLFRFAADLPMAEIFDPVLIAAYLCATFTVWALGFGVARARGLAVDEAAMEANTGAIGNTGFLGVPMLVVLLGPKAAGPVMIVLTVDSVVFAALLTVLVTVSRSGRLNPLPILTGLVRNPMIAAMVAGILWSTTGLALPGPVDEFLRILGAAATPGALFAIGVSLTRLGGGRPGPALWLAGVKLVAHPLAVATSTLLLFPVAPFAAGAMICAAALPVAGNVYMLAAHYGVAAQRVSTAILISTAVSILTVPGVIAWVTQ